MFADGRRMTAEAPRPSPRICTTNSVGMIYCRDTERMGFSHMVVGYMRVSSDGDRQVLDLQRDALLAASVDERHLSEDHASGSRGDRTGLAKALVFLRPDDCLVVWKLEHLGRSLPHLLATVNELEERRIGFRSLTEQMDATTPQGEFLFHIFGALAQCGPTLPVCLSVRFSTNRVVT